MISADFWKFFMAKATAEQSNSISIFWLKKNHCLIPKQFGGGIKSGTITWTLGMSKSSISYTLVTNTEDAMGEGDQIRLQFTQTNRWTEEKDHMDLKISLSTTPCNYGGVRYWFICPLSKNGQYCGRRVGVIYSIGKYFGCRHCGEIAYSAQMKGGIFRGSSVTMPDMERLEKEIKRYYYNGKPTRKYKRFIKMDETLGRDLTFVAAHLYKKR